MIKVFLIVNSQGKVRISKFYDEIESKYLKISIS